ncbi:hypothetical protein [Klebsiella phage vB_KshKPC-M]|nr:hypothetical protein [Klebsiella phage vB_KshKPC-M]
MLQRRLSRILRRACKGLPAGENRSDEERFVAAARIPGLSVLAYGERREGAQGERGYRSSNGVAEGRQRHSDPDWVRRQIPVRGHRAKAPGQGAGVTSEQGAKGIPCCRSPSRRIRRRGLWLRAIQDRFLRCHQIA